MPLWDSKYILQNGNNNFADDQGQDDRRGMFDDAIAELDPDKAGQIAGRSTRRSWRARYYLPFVFEKIINWRSSRLTNVYSTDAFSGQYDYVNLGVEVTVDDTASPPAHPPLGTKGR